MKGIIYKWTCNVNGKSYIGQTTNELYREREFLNENDNYTTMGSKIDNARKKYGLSEGTWTKTVLKRLWCKDGKENELRERLNYWEKYYIEKYDTFNNGYNSTSGGENNKIISEKSREKISKMARKQWDNYSEERKRQRTLELSNGTNEYHKKNKNHVTIKISKIISEKRKSRKIYPKLNIKPKSARGVIKMDIFGNEIERYETIKEASEKNNVYKGGISSACKGIKKIVCGFKWKYTDEKYTDEEKPTRGYSWIPRLKRWYSKVKIKGKSYSLGYFKNEETASKIYSIAKEKISNNEFFEWHKNIIEEKYKIMKMMGEV